MKNKMRKDILGNLIHKEEFSGVKRVPYFESDPTFYYVIASWPK